MPGTNCPVFTSSVYSIRPPETVFGVSGATTWPWITTGPPSTAGDWKIAPRMAKHGSYL